MAGALEGVKVLDCTQIIAGPLASALLAEMGAEVLHVEPLEGEPWRTQAEVLPKESRPFLYHNRGKLGIAIDLLHPSMSFLPNMREIVALDEEPRRQRLDQLAELRARGASIEEVYAARRKLQPELAGNIYYRIYQTKDSYLAVGCLGAELRERF